MNRQLMEKLERIGQTNKEIKARELTKLLSLTDLSSITRVMHFATELRDQNFHDQISYSRNVFIPLTHWCCNACGYCGFRKIKDPAFLTEITVETLLKAGKKARCREMLLTCGEKPELKYNKAKMELKTRGYSSSVELVRDICTRALDYGILPHVNLGVIEENEMLALQPTIASLGLMLESMDSKLGERGRVHEFSPTKAPAIRLAMLQKAGDLKIPFTTGILVGIGESIASRAHSILEIKKLSQQYGHIQEIIIQNFVPNSSMSAKHLTAPAKWEYLLTIALTRIICPTMNIQAPPNLNKGGEKSLLEAGINDWGGISSITIDHVNPASPWQSETKLRQITEDAGFRMKERLPVYEEFLTPEWIGERPLAIARSILKGDSDNISTA